MKYIYILIICFMITPAVSQNITVKTDYKSQATLDSVSFIKQKFVFTFLEKEKILIIKDMEKNVEKTIHIRFDQSFYYYNSSDFVKSYVTDIEIENEKNAGMFNIIYTKENGELIGVDINFIEENQGVAYRTELGKKVFKFKK